MAVSLDAEGEARRQQHVARELAAAEAQGTNTLAINYCKLCVVPECVLASEWAREWLQYLYLKYNSIQQLVSGGRNTSLIIARVLHALRIQLFPISEP